MRISQGKASCTWAGNSCFISPFFLLLIWWFGVLHPSRICLRWKRVDFGVCKTISGKKSSLHLSFHINVFHVQLIISVTCEHLFCPKVFIFCNVRVFVSVYRIGFSLIMYLMYWCCSWYLCSYFYKKNWSKNVFYEL